MERLCGLLVCFVSLTLAEFPTKEFVEQIRPTVEKCEGSTGVDKGLVEQFSRGESMPDDPKLKCYMKCIFLELDVLDPQTGYFKFQKMLNMLPEEMKSIAYDMGKNCVHFKGEEGTDMCQESYDVHSCWQRADPQVLNHFY
ncbi:general odorant-binding protein 83a-like isoform X2 [Hyposmocoma kahamanoa]|uniref:general odorant-binding protein 83a-like isoform X2 n=1 Tax=Hyposmocoma kahamanoa TaxID=1477025 RepID=UPI000E6D7B24|nr:general odorant-binding protein 83a-like isoform X2 [Hyposmocoma kahamanoa]